MRKYAGKRTGMARLFSKNPEENNQKRPVNSMNNSFQRNNKFQNNNTTNLARKG
jgi:hypothetical protein